MMDVSGEPSSPKGPLLHPPGERDSIRHNPQVPKLRPEELKMYKECSSSMYYLAGIPFACVCHLVSSVFLPPAKVELPQPRRILRRGIIFFGNMLLGTFLFGAPYCYNKLIQMHNEYEKRSKDSDIPMPEITEGIQPISQAEDFSYPTAAAGSFNEPEGSFSSDFNFSSIVTDDDEKIKTPSTTYQELRMRHRSSQNPTTTVTSTPLVASEPDLGLSGLSTPIDQPKSSEPPPPRKLVKRNKYGDEIE